METHRLTLIVRQKLEYFGILQVFLQFIDTTPFQNEDIFSRSPELHDNTPSSKKKIQMKIRKVCLCESNRIFFSQKHELIKTQEIK